MRHENYLVSDILKKILVSIPVYFILESRSDIFHDGIHTLIYAYTYFDIPAILEIVFGKSSRLFSLRNNSSRRFNLPIDA